MKSNENFKKPMLENMKNWTKKTMVEKDERLNKVKIKMSANDMAQKELL